MERAVDVAKPGVHTAQQRRDRAHELVHGDAEQEEREGDPHQGVDHAEHPARGGERGLLTVADGGDHRPGEEERLAEAPVGRVTGGQADAPPDVLGHITNVGVKIIL